MITHDVAVSTITWARSPDEQALLGRSMRPLLDLGFPVAVADRGDHVPFTRALREAGASVVVPERQGLVAQVQASLRTALGLNTPLVLYTEPDKELFFERALLEFVRHAAGILMSRDEPGIVLAGRSEEAFRTFPPMQRRVERIVNDLCRDLIGVPGDYCYGPFLMTRTLPEHADALPPELGWGWRTCLFMTARRHAMRVQHIHGPYVCPPEGRFEDAAEQAHRLRQLSQNVLGLAHGGS